MKHDYRMHFRKGVLVTVVLIVLITITSVLSLSVAKYSIGFSEAIDIIVNRLNGHVPSRVDDYNYWLKDMIVWDGNLPIAIGGVAVGVILGVAGAIMQSIIRNPLADPYTTGISSGAMFGVAVFMVLGVSVIPFTGGNLGLILNAFAFALVPSAVIVFVASFKKTSPTMMVLIGIGVMYMFSASTTLMMITASDETLADIYIWSVGSISKISWDVLPLILGAMIFLVVAGMFLSRGINVLSAGDNSATSLGVNPVKLRMICFIIVSISVAVAVCFTGPIGFVGLVSPHIARMLIGSNIRYLIPSSAAIGGFMLIAADCIARSVGTAGLPVGVITALIGSPLFLYFLIKQKKSAW